MKKALIISILGFILYGCGGGSGGGELQGVAGRPKYNEPEPFGMVFIPQGSYNMGPSDQDVAFSQNTMSKTVSVDAFWIDDTEITNNEYRQFVNWVRDSIMRKTLGDQFPEFVITEDELGNPIDPPLLNWETKIDLSEQDVNEAVKDMYLPEQERFYRRKEIDTRKLMYEYFWVDLQQAAKKTSRYNFKTKQYDGDFINAEGESAKIANRSSFVMRDVVNIYPDTLCWIADFTYSFNEPTTTMYFWHPSFDNYPVVGVSWKQATAFSIWRTRLMNNALSNSGEPFVQDYRLPIEGEWEYAARGGLALSMYPWGGLYTRNNQGCFLANFKPMRGRYGDDGGMTCMRVGSFEPNDFNLYDMAGNVAEWTANAYDESSYAYTHDLNPDYKYNARPDDPPVLKRKTIRGGSWKDIASYLQVSNRTYEYQDTSKSYIGFRCVRSYLGNSN